MRLAFVIFRYFPYGGLQRSALNIAKEALKRGHSVTFFCGEWVGEIPDGIEVRVVRKFVYFNTAGVTSFIKGFAAEFQRNNFDMLVGFNKMPGLDVYYCGDSCFAEKALNERSWLYRLAPRTRLYLKHENAVFSCDSNTRILDVSPSERSRFARFYATALNRFYSLPPGLQREHVLGSAQNPHVDIRSEFDVPADVKLLVCVGSGFRTKGLDRSISAFADLIQRKQILAYLLVVGDDNSASFQSQAERLGVASRVIFAGGRADMAAIYRAADLVLHPAYREVAGNVLLEAMLAGVPVVTTDICGYASYVRHYDMGQVIAAPYSSVDIAQAIVKLLAIDKAVWAERGRMFDATADIYSRSERAVDLLESFESDIAAPNQWHYREGDQQVILRHPFIDRWPQHSVFNELEAIPGTLVRAMPGRNTVRFEFDSKAYYRKCHFGVGWREIFKNLMGFRLPVIGASNEWYALNKLAALDIPSLTPLAYGRRGRNPAYQQSFLVTAELAGMIKLDLFFAQKVSFSVRRLVIAEVARVARALHSAGINHRDFYLCHFLLDDLLLKQSDGESAKVYLVDLHRAQLRISVPYRWWVKDIGALYFSALDTSLTRSDIIHFLKIYFDQDLRGLLNQHRVALRDIERRAIATYRRDFSKEPKLLFSDNLSK